MSAAIPLFPSIADRLKDDFGDIVETVTLFGGQQLEIHLFQVRPGDWIAQDGDNDKRRCFGTTAQDARDNLIERVSDDLGICVDCRCGFECHVCDIEEKRS